MGECRFCSKRMTHEAFQVHSCPLKVECELFAQRFPDREMAAKAAFVAVVEKHRRGG